jgi:hypothetical protein
MKRLTINIPQDRGVLYDLIRYPAGEIQVRLTESGFKQAQECMSNWKPKWWCIFCKLSRAK